MTTTKQNKGSHTNGLWAVRATVWQTIAPGVEMPIVGNWGGRMDSEEAAKHSVRMQQATDIGKVTYEIRYMS